MPVKVDSPETDPLLRPEPPPKKAAKQLPPPPSRKRPSQSSPQVRNRVWHAFARPAGFQHAFCAGFSRSWLFSLELRSCHPSAAGRRRHVRGVV